MFQIEYLNELRRIEMEEVIAGFPPSCKVLEFGSGTGKQAQILADNGFEVVAIDLATSDYADDRVYPITEYDGHRIPVSDRSIDVIFSSNVLEHVENLEEIFAEFHRVLKPGGFAVHVLPTPEWRFWTFITGVASSARAALALPGQIARPADGRSRWSVLHVGLRAIASGLVPRAHGTSAEGISELWTFSRSVWRRKFEKSGFEIVSDQPLGLFYTGILLFGSRLPIERRRALAGTLGSATRLFKVRPSQRAQ